MNNKIISANSNEFLDFLYKSLETHPIVINACMSRTAGCDNNVYIQNKDELDIIHKDKIYIWRPQNRLIVCKTPKVIFEGNITYEELFQKKFPGGCLCGFGKKPIILRYIEEFTEDEDNFNNLPANYQYVIEEIKWYDMKDVAYVPLNSGELVRGVY